MSIPETAYTFCSCFEGELLVELMLKYWNHPLSDDNAFRNQLLESAAEALKASIAGSTLLEGIPPDQVNFVAAIYYAESMFVEGASHQGPSSQLQERTEWLNTVRRTLPSCFCDQDDLLP
jgi:hypothetical protein